MKFRLASTIVVAVGLIAATGCASGGGAGEGTATEVDDPELQTLIDSAREEGSLTVYGIPEEAVQRAVADEFTAKYGIDVTILRLVSADLSQRYAAEASAGSTEADAILLTYSPFFEEAYAEGWLTPITEADIPGVMDEFPEDFVQDDGTPIASLVPTEMVYNTDEVAEEPTSWEAYADPNYQGKVLMTEPASSPANLTFWSLMIDEYGEGLLEDIAANEPTWMNSAVNTTQGVAAGEGVLAHPGVRAIVENLKAEGAPVESVALLPTTGPEIALGLSADSPHPNAAKLFAHYILGQEGNDYLSEQSGAISLYDTERVSGWHRPGPVGDDVAAKINELFGL
ncbi:ABC transporter substrate-binding protein [Microbacterium faecale]|uniref:ABC transporter substrate-binding protein n=1 Tax=Microbacterium faecale TaxID=1804630 RepID=A0A917DDQ5_9MICO|nr:extracellular solute-binding protein [Microbacterium faecale]GGD28644.1 ABC transporter substrate-binding protein [Microbacterium faecale]